MKTPAFSLLLSPLILGISLLTSPHTATAQTLLLQDDFDDGVIDSTLWTTDALPIAPFFLPRSVTESGGVVEFVNRGYLISATDYDPVPLEGNRIRGR